MIKIIVKGASGRMGQRITALAKEDPHFQVVSTAEEADVMIDFSHPDVTLKYLDEAVKNRIPTVIGTTGYLPEQRSKIEAYAKKIPMIVAPNTSVGVNLLAKLLERTAKALGNNFKITITETHHIHKKDKPSGTALHLARAVAAGAGMETSKIPIESIREGEVVGLHTIRFESNGEALEFTHNAKSRDTFALGALRAAQWLVGKPNGLYSMADVLELK